jgi:RND family efflux transporter MFP subunit
VRRSLEKPARQPASLRPGWLAILLLLSMLTVTACGQSQAEGPKKSDNGGKPGAADAEKSASPDAGRSGSAPGSPPDVKPIPVTTARSESRPVQRMVETSGSLLAWEDVVLNTAIAGTVSRLLVDLGDRVRAGQVVAELDAREYALAVNQAEATLLAGQNQVARTRAQVAAAEANLRQIRESIKTWEANQNRARVALEEAQINLERTRHLHQKELIAARDLDAARTQYETMLAQSEAAQVEMTQYPDRVRVAEAALESDRSAARVAESEVKQREAALGIARKRLADTTLRVPIAGAVAKRHVNTGEFLKENTPVFTIVALDPVKYAGTVPERYAPELKTGQPLQLTVEAYGAATFNGQITRLAPAVDVQTRTLELEGRVPNADGRLRPGFFTKGAVLTGKDAAAVFVPAEALTYIAGITKIFVIADGRAQERIVKPGVRQGPLVEITSGVKAGEVVAISNLPQLFNGAPVNIAGSR